MNFKTTVFLLVVMVSAFGWLVVQRSGDDADKNIASPPIGVTAGLDRELFETPPDDIVKVSCASGSETPWVFERAEEVENDTQSGWQITEPFASKVPKYEVEGIINRLKNLKYQIKYAPGDDGAVTAAQAGLDPPETTVTLHQGDGTDLTVYVGKQATTSEHYVRVGDAPDIYIVRTSLDRLLKKNAFAYRDKELIQFDKNDAVGITVTYRTDDGETSKYRLTKSDDEWNFVEPFSARAESSAIDTAMRAMSQLRAGEWADPGAAGKPLRIGLSPAQLDITVTCEKTVEMPNDEADAEADEEPEPKTETRTETHRLLVSSRGPLGKSNVVYAKLADRDAICTILKSTVERLTPTIDKWRNLKVVPAGVASADRVQLSTADGETAELVKGEDGKWTFAEENAPADKKTVRELLDKIDALKAISFVDGADATAAEFGLTAPQATITIHVAGRDEPERIAIGGPTDAASKRLYYVRRGESSSIAKIRAGEIDVLTRGPLAYLNREILTLAPSTIERIQVTRSNAITDESESIAMIRVADRGPWRMNAPIDADADAGTALTLSTTVATLRALSVVARSASAETHGLDNPDVTVAITYIGTPTVKFDEDGEATPTRPETESVELKIKDAGEAVYVKRQDRSTVYELARTDYDALLADFHTKAVLDFEQSQVRSIAVTSGAVTHTFEKKDDQWVYAAELDLPIDEKKVTNLLAQAADLKLTRIVAYESGDLGRFGLDQPARKVSLVTGDSQTPTTLLISAKQCDTDDDKSFYAMVEGRNIVFLLTPDALAPFAVSLSDYELTTGS